MATNKILNIQQWATVATVSNPEAGYKKIYPKTGSDYWYTLDSQGNEKEIGVSLDIKNGLKLTTLSPSSIYNYQLDLALGSGLTFSGNFAGSLLSVSGLTAGSLSSIGAATAGYILSVTGSGQFNWIQFTTPGVSGTTNRIAKFNSPTSISDSLIRDNGSNVYIGATPSFAVGLLNVNGDFFANKYYISDNTNTFINYANGVYVQTDLGFKINRFTYNYLSFTKDTINNYYTFSVLDGLVEIGDAASNYINATNIDSVIIGRTSSGTSSVYLYSNNSNLLTLDTNGNSGALILKDGTQALNKIFVSDSNGRGTWQYLNAHRGVTISGLTLSSNISGYGLTLSGNSLTFDYSVFGNTLTYSTGIVNLSTTGVTSGTYGSSASIAQITVDTYGRVTNVVTYSISQGTNVFIGAGSGLTGSGSNTRVVFWNGTQSLSSTTRFTFVDATSGTTGAQLTIGAANNTNTGGQLYLAQSDSYTNAGSIIRFGTTAGNTNQWTILAFGLTYSNTNDGSGGAFDYSNTDRAGSMRIGPASNLSGNGQDFQIFCSDFAVGGTTYTSTAPEAMRFKPDNGLRIDLQNNLLTKGYSASTALLDLGASRTTRASLRIRMGSAPTTPNIGDIYGTSTRDLNFNSNLVLPTVGDGIKIKEGIDATMGRATLVGGTVTVNTTKATTTCEIFLTSRVDGGTPGTAVRVSALSNGTSFTITSTNILDTSEISWLIIESV